MNAKISVFAICVEAIIYLLLYNLHDCTFKSRQIKRMVESEYYLNLESESKKRYKDKLTLSNGERLPDPNVLDVGWKEEVHNLPDLCFADIFNYLINTSSDYTKKNLKACKSLEAYNFFVCRHVHNVLYHQIAPDSQFCFIKTKVSCLLLVS